MADVLLVDGYNMIGSWDELAPLKETGLDAARDALCGILSRYVSYRWDRIIVVFDAYRVPGRKRLPVSEDSFAVIFSGEGETADLAIERLTGDLVAAGHTVQVATSDALEQLLILAKGATRISARELRLQFLEIDRQMDEKYTNPGSKRQMLDTRLDEHTRDVLERWRQGR
ncbi:MAG: NYN domain-containing protein [Bacillota bacterium]|nr:NYN domain-containing protein [Bacillota bacterium]MDW7683784.1 NYN domain-containing protein [Bacillota bacterium]